MISARTPESQWFWDHYEGAAQQVVDFVGAAGMDLAGSQIADIGCGDGILDLGVAHRAKPARLVGFDINETDVGHLRRRATEEQVDEIPAELEFRRSDVTGVPAEDEEFDLVMTWSAFEHVREPVSLLREARRIMKRNGALFLQLWPFYHADRGSHLWDWYPDPFHHLLQTEDEIAAGMRASDVHPPEWTEYMLDEYRHLNRTDVDELQRALLAAGLYVARMELMTNAVALRPEHMRYPLSLLGISGVKLLAIPLP